MATFKELKERVRFLSSTLSEQNRKMHELREKAAADYEHLSGTIRYLKNANQELAKSIAYYSERYHELLLKTGETGSTRPYAPAERGSAGEVRYAD